MNRRSPRYAISTVSDSCAASISASRWLIIGQLLLAMRLAAVDEEVEAARRIELVVAGHALAQARDVLGALGLDHHVDPVVAVVVADAHRAEREVAIVDDVELAVIEPLAHVLDA